MSSTFKRLAVLSLSAGLAAAALAAAPAASARTAPKPSARAAADGPPATLDLSDCPDVLPVGADPANWYCNVLVTSGGSMKIGKIDQQITAPMRITMLAGYDPKTGAEISKFVKMRSAAMSVAGGALGIPGTESVPLFALKVKPQYAGKIDLDIPNRKTRLALKLKLVNQLLGDTCYVGSNAAPITLDLDLKEITGALGPDGTFWVKINSTDDTFAVPKTNGCGFAAPIADLRGGLPSASGANHAQLISYFGGKGYSEMYPKMAVRRK
ncbi:hypothetical protein GCM10010402_78180 [Actinomadura luteofluorescens]|uniref:hypothetical protein n=1 Tax=Actinomadura luteofluorescens TaxID=46163 RepID=UPI00216456EE|nr:hypothetical protein [Actinomadura glauciflava]MCR3744798.1 hypothetical protein [Actinomadura glauciflava]